MKTKIFSSADIYSLEKEINEWLEINNWVKILNQTQSTGQNNTVICIWYAEPEVPILG